jgi:hypothetical protein
MKRSELRRFVLISCGVLVGVVLVVASAQHVAAASGTLRVGSGSASVGGQAFIAVDALGVTAPGLGAWTVDVQYDSSLLTAVSCTASAGGVCNPEFGADRVRITGANADGLEGDSSLATIGFRCEGIGTSSLTPIIPIFADATVGDPMAIDVAVQAGSVSCTSGAGPGPSPGPQPPSGAPTCESFAYQEDAQTVLKGDPTQIQLDPDGDRIACEELPSRPWQAGAAYRGTVAGGGTVEVLVSGGGTGIAAVNIVAWDTLCAVVTQRSTVSPPVRIVTQPIGINFFEHVFIVGPAEPPLTVLLQGQFRPNGTLEGSITIQSDFDPQCNETEFFVGTLAGGLSPAPAPQPLAPVGPAPVLPNAGAGRLWDAESPWVWPVAGLIGAGIAWLLAGVAGARFALASAGSRAESRAPFRPALRPTRSGEGDVHPTPYRTRPAGGRKSWFSAAVEDLPGIARMERFRRRTGR